MEFERHGRLLVREGLRKKNAISCIMGNVGMQHFRAVQLLIISDHSL